jgi:hypothetical protein
VVILQFMANPKTPGIRQRSLILANTTRKLTAVDRAWPVILSSMPAKLTRRSFAALAGAAGLLGQTPSPPPLPKNPEEELKAARETAIKNAEQLAKVELPMSTEPAFHFKP